MIDEYTQIVAAEEEARVVMRSGIRRANSQTEALQSLQEAQRTET